MAVKKRKKKKKGASVAMGLFSGLATAFMLLALLLILDARHTEAEMLGEPRLTLAYGETYEDPGVVIRSVGRIFPPLEEPQTVYAAEVFSPTRLGTQTLSYHFADHGREQQLTREITVVDTEKPVLEILPMPEGEAPSWLHGYREPEVTAHDNVDGDMSGIVELTRLEDRLVYSVTDSSGNEAVLEWLLPVGLDAPVIELTGGEDYTVPAAMSWQEPGFAVRDFWGNDLSALVTVEGEVTPYRSGDYELSYSLSNDFGETVTAVRHVTVAPVVQSDTVYPSQKTIYLTFDDGPGPYTDQLLDILAKYNVKATFFITGNQPDYLDCIGRAYREGHSIGVHSKTHNYYTIYASEEAFFEDFNQCQEIIYAQTGAYTTLFRFPGGSSNTVSRFNPGIMSRLTRSMTDMGYYYFDWNVSSGDAGGTTDTDKVFENVTEGCKYSYNVVLQHDIKGFSVAAVERIIVWGLNNGYQFLPLEESSFGAHHGVNN